MPTITTEELNKIDSQPDKMVSTEQLFDNDAFGRYMEEKPMQDTLRPVITGQANIEEILEDRSRRAGAKRFFEEEKDPQAARDRFTLTLHFSEKMNLPFDTVDNTLDEIVEQYNGSEKLAWKMENGMPIDESDFVIVPPAKGQPRGDYYRKAVERLKDIAYPEARVGPTYERLAAKMVTDPEAAKWIGLYGRENRNFLGKTVETMARQYKGNEADIALANMVFKGGDWKKGINIKDKLLEKEALDPIEGNVLGEAFYGGMGIVAQQASNLKNLDSKIPLATAIGGGIIGGVIGNIIPGGAALPEEGATIPTGFATGGKVGLAFGAKAAFFEVTWKQGFGSFFYDMIKDGHDPQIAAIVAEIGAIPYAAIEFAQVKSLTPGLRQGLKPVIRKSVMDVVLPVIKKYGATWSQNVGEEILQQLNQRVAVDVSAYLNGKGIPDPGDWLSKTAGELNETAIEAGKSFALLPLPGAVMDFANSERIVSQMKTDTVEKVETEAIQTPETIETGIDIITKPIKDAKQIIADASKRLEELNKKTEDELTTDEYIEKAFIEENKDNADELGDISDFKKEETGQLPSESATIPPMAENEAARNIAPQETAEAGKGFRVGDDIIHPFNGEGKIIELTQNKELGLVATIDFNDGKTRSLVLKYANITKKGLDKSSIDSQIEQSRIGITNATSGKIKAENNLAKKTALSQEKNPEKKLSKMIPHIPGVDTRYRVIVKDKYKINLPVDAIQEPAFVKMDGRFKQSKLNQKEIKAKIESGEYVPVSKYVGGVYMGEKTAFFKIKEELESRLGKPNKSKLSEALYFLDENGRSIRLATHEVAYSFLDEGINILIGGTEKQNTADIFIPKDTIVKPNLIVEAAIKANRQLRPLSQVLKEHKDEVESLGITFNQPAPEDGGQKTLRPDRVGTPEYVLPDTMQKASEDFASGDLYKDKSGNWRSKKAKKIVSYSSELRKNKVEEADLKQYFESMSQEEQGKYGKSNKLISKDMYEQALKDMGGQGLQSGISPQQFKSALYVSLYHFEAGLRQLSAWTEQMIKEFGEGIKPYLDDLWKKTKETFSENKIAEKTERIEKKEAERIVSKHTKDAEIRIKTAIRKITGQAKIGKLLREETALKAAMKKAEQASKTGFRAGKKEGIEITRQRQEEIKQRQKEVFKQRAYIKKLAKIIAKPVSKNVDFYYREAIENIQAGIDPQMRTTKTRTERERTKEFLSRNPDKLKDMPVKLLGMLNKKTINDMTVDELEASAIEVQRLKKQGKLKLQFKKNEEKRQFENDKQDILSTILKGEQIEQKEYGQIEEIDLVNIKAGTRLFGLEAQRVFDKLDSTKAKFNGVIHNLFFNLPNQAVNEDLMMQHKRADACNQYMKKAGIKISDLAKSRDVLGRQYYVQDIIDIYVKMKNEASARAIVNNNLLGDPDGVVQAAIDTLTPKEKAFGDWIIKEYSQYYPEWRKEVIDVTNEDPGHEENYTSMRVKRESFTPIEEEVKLEIEQRRGLKQGKVNKDATYKRVEHAHPIELGIYSHWLDDTRKQSHYITHASLIKRLSRLKNDSDIRNAIKQKFGVEYVKFLDKYISDVANPNIYKAFTGIEKVGSTIRHHASIVYLAYKLATVLKQPIAIIRYLPDAGFGHLMASIYDFTTNPTGMVKGVFEKDPQIKHLMMERELEEIKLLEDVYYKKIGNVTIDVGKYHRLQKKIANTGFWGMVFADQMTRVIGWNAVYQKGLADGLSEEAAIREAQNVTLRTQSAAATKDIPEIYRSNELYNGLLMFTREINKLYQITTYDLPNQISDKNFQKAIYTALALALGGMLEWSISRRRLPEKPEDFANMVAENTIGEVPIIGSFIMSSVNGFDNNIVYSELTKQLVKAATTKDEEKQIEAILQSIALGAGLPYFGPRAYLKFAQTGNPQELIGGKPTR